MTENNKIEEFLLLIEDDEETLYNLTYHTTQEINDTRLTQDKVRELLRKDFKGENPNDEMKHFRKYLDDLDIKHDLVKSKEEK